MSGAQTLSGAIAAAVGGPGVAASGMQTFSAELQAQLQPLTADMTGAVLEGVAGQVAATVGGVSASMSGALQFNGAWVSTPAGATMSADGTVEGGTPPPYVANPVAIIVPPERRVVVLAHEQRIVRAASEIRVIHVFGREEQSMNVYPSKDPAALLAYQMDWSAWLGADEAITDAEVTVADGITLNPDGKSTAFVDGKVTFWLGGGVPGTGYVVSCRITTNTGQIDKRSAQLPVLER